MWLFLVTLGLSRSEVAIVANFVRTGRNKTYLQLLLTHAILPSSEDIINSPVSYIAELVDGQASIQKAVTSSLSLVEVCVCGGGGGWGLDLCGRTTTTNTNTFSASDGHFDEYFIKKGATDLKKRKKVDT